MVATSGDRLLTPDAIEQLRRLLIPKALVVTPNLPEAAALLDTPIAEDEAAMRDQAQRLLALGAKAVLIKGGHGDGPESVDLLVDAERRPRACRAERIATRNTHGTGCTLSSAIAAGLAKGLTPHRGRARGQELRHRGDRRRGPAVDRHRATVRCIIFIVSGEHDASANSGASNDKDHATKACSQRSSRCSRRASPRPRSRARRPSAGAW